MNFVPSLHTHKTAFEVNKIEGIKLLLIFYSPVQTFVLSTHNICLVKK